MKNPGSIGKQGNISQLGGEFIFGPGTIVLFLVSQSLRYYVEQVNSAHTHRVWNTLRIVSDIQTRIWDVAPHAP